MPGVGMYDSVGAATAAVKTALHSAILTALADDEQGVDVSFGFVWPPPTRWDVVAVTSTRTQPSDGTLGPNRRRQMTVYQDLSVLSFRVTGDEQIVHDRAYAVLGSIDAHLRANPTLDGAVLWVLSDDVNSDGATSEEDAGQGRVCEIAATYAAQIIVTR